MFHAVGAPPEGPYDIRDVVIEGKAGDACSDDTAAINAKIYQVADRYVLL